MNEFNSKQYTYCDMQVVVFGRPLLDMRGLEYKAKKNKEVLYASGRKGRGIQHGKREYDGTLTLLQSDVIALDRAAQEKGHDDCLDLDFDIIVSYLGDNGIVTVDRIVSASITEVPKGLKEGDLYMEVALPFIALDVKPNVV